jgi:hypothetical protein
MRDIAKLVFGLEPSDEREPFAPGRAATCGGIDTRAADWCKTPPGQEALNWLGSSLRRQARRRKI